MQFPDQLIDEYKKDLDWGFLHIEYAKQLLTLNNPRIAEMNDTYKSFNGIKPFRGAEQLNKTKGKKNYQEMIPYRACTTKINLMVGEFLTRPLRPVVTTINRDAKLEKMDKTSFLKGLMIARDEVAQLKDKAGVDVAEGMEIPMEEGDETWQKMNTKDKEEVIMQILIDQQIPHLDLKGKFGDQVRDAALVSRIFGKIERDNKGNTRYIQIDPRDAIYERSQRDPFLEKSVIKGARTWLPLHEVVRMKNWSKKQLEILKEIGNNPKNYYETGYVRPTVTGNGTLFAVIHIEWKSIKTLYSQKVKKTATQMMFNPEEEHIEIPLDTEKYQRNREHWDNKEGVEIMPKYCECLYEATCVAGMKELIIDFGEAKWQMRRVDDPTYVFDGSYVGVEIGEVDGKIISLYQQMENWGNMFDVVVYQILKEISAYKGKFLVFNNAGLRAKQTVKDVMYDMVNDRFITVDTSASGNFHGKDTSANVVDVRDIGLSESFGALVAFKDDILRMMDRMTGINNDREGQIMASATATNTNSAIQASRTITEPFFFAIYQYINKVLTRIAESTKITYAFYKIEEGKQVLGIDKWNYLVMTQEMGYKDYDVHLEDSGKYREVMEFMKLQMANMLNAKEITPDAALDFAWAETAVEQRQILSNGWKKIKDLQSQMNDANNQNAMAMQQQQLQVQMQLAQEDREDRQINEKDNIVLQGDTDIRVNQAKSKDDVIVNQHKYNNENILGDSQSI